MVARFVVVMPTLVPLFEFVRPSWSVAHADGLVGAAANAKVLSSGVLVLRVTETRAYRLRHVEISHKALKCCSRDVGRRSRSRVFMWKLGILSKRNKVSTSSPPCLYVFNQCMLAC